MQKQGWIKIHRQLLDWEWYSDTNVCRVFLHLLLKANHKPNKWKGTVINTGEVLTGRKILAQEANLSEMQIRSALNKLKSTNEITIKSTNSFSIIKLNNWDSYQQDNQQSTERITNEQPTDNQRITTNKNDNNTKNEKNEEILEVVKFFEESFKTKVLVISDKRKKHIGARLKVFSLEEIKKAIYNFSTSEFHTGENDRGWKADLDWIIKNDEQIEKGLKLEEQEIKNSNRATPTQERSIKIEGMYFTERERNEIKEKELVILESGKPPRFKEGWKSQISFKL